MVHAYYKLISDYVRKSEKADKVKEEQKLAKSK